MLTASPLNATSVALEWRNREGVTHKTGVERREVGSDFAEIALLDPGTNKHEDSGLRANTRYTYRVYYANRGGRSEPSNEASAVTHPPGGAAK
ncbi:MAG: fibronectin type III domain-containing protein [Nitrospirae bacterium]|nr:fibronectin type III domain-containing protein [Nitrospirota bacterium]